MSGTQKELAKLEWQDPLLIEDLLTDDERMIRDTARAYAQEKLQPRIIEAYREEKTDRSIFFGLTIASRATFLRASSRLAPIATRCSYS